MDKRVKAMLAGHVPDEELEDHPSFPTPIGTRRDCAVQPDLHGVWVWAGSWLSELNY